jgi:Domain of unknown function (DUF3458_C) ARM repeats
VYVRTFVCAVVPRPSSNARSVKCRSCQGSLLAVRESMGCETERTSQTVPYLVAGNVKLVRSLEEHEAFNVNNPNNCYSLYLGFGRSPVNFHAADGSGYDFFADAVLKARSLQIGGGGGLCSPHGCDSTSAMLSAAVETDR